MDSACLVGVCFQADLRKHISRLHGDLAADQQLELLTLRKLSSAELAQNQSSSVRSDSVYVNAKPWQRTAYRNMQRGQKRQKAATNFHKDFVYYSDADSGDVKEQVMYKVEPVRVPSDCLVILMF